MNLSDWLALILLFIALGFTVESDWRLNKKNVWFFVLAVVAACIGGYQHGLFDFIKAGSNACQPVETAESAVLSRIGIDGLQYVSVPAGGKTFCMGCSIGDKDCVKGDEDQRAVKLQRAFEMTQTEVTVGAYRRFVNANNKPMPLDCDHPGQQPTDSNLPMVCVTQPEAEAFCQWAGGPHGHIPTEEQWEYAARAGTIAKSYNPDLSRIAWYNDSRHPVGKKEPNNFGLYDMLGNAEEWTSTVFDPLGHIVIRGGSFDFGANLVRVSTRLYTAPSDRSPRLGFRCVLEP